MHDFWETELTEEETEGLVAKAAAQIRRRGMTVPAVLALEMCRPLSNVGASAVVVNAPFLVPFFGFDAVNDYSRLFTKRENVERLLRELEKKQSKEEAPCP